MVVICEVMKKRWKFEMEDRISTLPRNIVELIFMHLPIAEAVRTSILSSKWRYQWCTIPHLIFDKRSIPSRVKFKLENVVEQVLLLHCGPIDKFSLDAYSGIKDIAPIDRWLVFLSRNYLKELTLKSCSVMLYKLPTALFSCHALVSLDLQDCEFLKLPRSFNGFTCLTNLLFKNIWISESDFAFLISKCPILRKLVFIDPHFYSRCHLKVNAPKLQELVVKGVFTGIHLENTPDLASLCIRLKDVKNVDYMEFDNGDTENAEECYFSTCLSNIPKIEKLELKLDFLDVMTRRHAFVRFPTYICLKKVFLGYFNFGDLKHVMTLQSLLQNTPVLKELEVLADSYESIATIPIASFFSLDQLQNVRLIEVVGVRAEMEFIEFILSSASKLESLFIKLRCEANKEVKLYKEIMRFRRASNRAEIVMLD